MNKRISLNLIGQVVAFLCSLGISFFITPFVVSGLGKEVYGFVNLATSFTSYISLFTIALTSMLARYVTVEYYRKDYEHASQYFSTAVFTQLLLALVLVVPAMLFTSNMEKYVDISPSNVSDVKILWGLVFLSFLISLPGGCYNVGAFTSNRLDLRAIATIISNVVRAAVLLFAFMIFPARVWYIGIATILAQLVTIVGDVLIKKRYLSQVKLSLKHYRISSIFDLVVVGIWNSFSRLSQILNTGLDLLLTNIFINGTEMGLLSIAKAIPAQLGNLSGSVYNAFEPSMTIVYSEDEKDGFVNITTYAMKLNGFICSIPMMGFLCFGKAFYRLWMPSLTSYEIDKVFILAVLTMMPQILEIYVQPLYALNTITKKLSVPVIVNVIQGLVNVVLVFVCLKTTSLGIYAIAGISSVLSIIKIITFMPIYAAKCVSYNWKCFYGPLVRGVLNSSCIISLFTIVVLIVNMNSWLKLVVVALICGVFGYLISLNIMFNKEERSKLINTLKSKIAKK